MLMKNRGWCIFCVLKCLILVLFCAVPANAQTSQKDKSAKQAESVPVKYMRVPKDKEGNVTALQTAIGRYELKRQGQPKVRVDLIGVVHIGDKQYYEKLNKQFQYYDALLYELVAPPNLLKQGVNLKKQSGTSPLSKIQILMKDALQLEFQLEQIDYSQNNFVHADMSPEQLFQTMQKKGETPLNLFLRLMQANMVAQSQSNSQTIEVALMMTAFDPPAVRSKKLKQIFANEFVRNESFLTSLNGKEGLALITDRNDVALEVMQTEINNGKTKLGIFYGAGHMEDMHGKLIDLHKMTLVNTVWLDAWKIDASK